MLSRHVFDTGDMESRVTYHGWWTVAVSAVAMSTGPGQFAFGASLGPYAFGLAFETYGSYMEVLITAVIVMVISAFITLLLPVYKKTNQQG